MYYVGIDVAKHKHDISVLNQDGDVLFTLTKLANSNAGANRFLVALQKNEISTRDCLVGMVDRLY